MADETPKLKKVLLPGVGAPMILPTSSIPPRSPDLLSAYAFFADDAVCEKLDQVRATMAKVGKVYVDRIDTAICFLALDMGYPAEDITEMLADTIDELLSEAKMHGAKI